MGPQVLLKGSLLHVQTKDGYEGVVYAQRSGKDGPQCLIAFIGRLRDGSGTQSFPFKDLKILGRKDMNHKLWWDKLPTPIR